MGTLHFQIEIHRQGYDGPLEVVSIDAERLDSGRPYLAVEDISHAFNASDEILIDFAYSARFTLPLSFTGQEAVFGALEEFGLPRHELVRSCGKAAAELTDA